MNEMTDLPGSDYTIDPVSLRAKPVDPMAMEVCARKLQDEAQQLPDPVESGRRASYAALLFTLLGKYDIARKLIDFALQHQGKVLFDQGWFAAALERFNEALDLRRIKQLPELIASTELAIETTRELQRCR